MRLIDADELKKHKVHSKEFHEKVVSVAQIDWMPTVDAVEVVRCKDCRWFENDGYHTNCQIMRFCVEDDDYCSRGERREDGKIG